MRWTNYWLRKLVRSTHHLQFLVEWAVDNPEYFDHNIDMYSSWYKTRESFPIERGVFSSLAMTANGNVLDLCCGDGFNSYHFYSLRAKHVTAIDFDREAIRWAKRNYKAPNLTFSIGDIRTDIPDGPFDNIVWDAAVEHFTETEITDIMSRLKSVLTPSGTLSGYTIIEPAGGVNTFINMNTNFTVRKISRAFSHPILKMFTFLRQYSHLVQTYISMQQMGPYLSTKFRRSLLIPIRSRWLQPTCRAVVALSLVSIRFHLQPNLAKKAIMNHNHGTSSASTLQTIKFIFKSAVVPGPGIHGHIISHAN